MRKLKSKPQQIVSLSIAKYSDKIISLGGKITEEIIKFIRIPREKVVEIANAVDLGYIESKTLSTINRPKVDNVFLFGGRLSYNKGVRELVKAFSSSELRNASLFVIGDGLYEKNWKRRKAKNITFIGQVEENTLLPWYTRGSIFIFPILFERMPSVVLEATACESPIIATDIGAISTIVREDNYNGPHNSDNMLRYR